MTLLTNTAEGGTNGTNVTVSNSGTSGNPFTLVNQGGGSMQYSSDYPAHGTLGFKVVPSSTGSTIVRWGGYNVSTFAFRTYVYIPAASSWPTVNVYLMRAATSGDATIARCVMSSTSGTISFQVGSGGSSVGNFTGLTTNTMYRIEGEVTVGSSAPVACRIYSLDSTTPLQTITSSTANTGTTNMATVDFGVANTSTWAGPFYLDDPAINDGSTTPIGPYTTPLATPVVTLGATTNPTTSSSTDGSQVVTWGAVSNAVSYEAWLAPNGSPAQGDFVRIATGVTSPYTFPGLGQGIYSFGIKAKAS